MERVNEKANEVLLKLVNKAMNGIDAAVQFSQAQIPEVIHQLLMWNAVSSILIQVLAILIAFTPVVVFVRKWEVICDNDAEASVILNLFTVPFGAILFFTNFDWLKIWLAPKLYLLEYAASLMK